MCVPTVAKIAEHTAMPAVLQIELLPNAQGYISNLVLLTNACLSRTSIIHQVKADASVSALMLTLHPLDVLLLLLLNAKRCSVQLSLCRNSTVAVGTATAAAEGKTNVLPVWCWRSAHRVA